MVDEQKIEEKKEETLEEFKNRKIIEVSQKIDDMINKRGGVKFLIYRIYKRVINNGVIAKKYFEVNKEMKTEDSFIPQGSFYYLLSTLISEGFVFEREKRGFFGCSDIFLIYLKDKGDDLREKIIKIREFENSQETSLDELNEMTKGRRKKK